MFSKFFVTALTVALAATACASATHDFVPVDNTGVFPGDDPLVSDFNDGSYYSFDLLVNVLPNAAGHWDDWTITEVEAAISGPAAFFQHPAGSDVPPDPNLIAQYPAVEFDSYFGPHDEIGFAGSGPVNEPTWITACWFDSLNMGLGTYAIARFTVHWLGPEPATLTVEGHSVFDNCTEAFGPYTVTIPEAGALTLLALGALPVLLRRR